MLFVERLGPLAILQAGPSMSGPGSTRVPPPLAAPPTPADVVRTAVAPPVPELPASAVDVPPVPALPPASGSPAASSDSGKESCACAMLATETKAAISRREESVLMRSLDMSGAIIELASLLSPRFATSHPGRLARVLHLSASSGRAVMRFQSSRAHSSGAPRIFDLE